MVIGKKKIKAMHVILPKLLMKYWKKTKDNIQLFII